MQRGRIGFIIAAALVVVGLGVGVWGFSVWRTVDSAGDRFIDNVFIDGIELSGKTREEAVTQLTTRNRARLEELRILLRYNEREWLIDSSRLEASLDIERQVNVAWERGHVGGFWKKNADIRETRRYPLDIETVMTYNHDALVAEIEAIKAEIDTPMTNATMSFEPNNDEKFTLVNEVPGRELEIAPVVAQAEAMLSEHRGGVIELAVRDIPPEISVETLKKATNRIKKFTTDLGRSGQARIDNIRLALSNFNGMQVLPGERVSFNDTTGDRSVENGYQDAPQIYGNNLVDGPGGGVCQASTTLYNAWVMSGLKVVKRTRHSIPSSYVPIGHDAAVAYDYMDLVLENDSDLPVFINCGVSGNKVFVSIYGRSLPANTTYKIEEKVIQEIPAVEPTVVKDRAGEYVKYTDQTLDNPPSRKGYEVETYLVTLVNGKETERKRITHDTYPAKPGTRYVGVTERSSGSSSGTGSGSSGSGSSGSGSSGSGSSGSGSSGSGSGSSGSGSSGSSTPKPEATPKPAEATPRPDPAPEPDPEPQPPQEEIPPPTENTDSSDGGE